MNRPAHEHYAVYGSSQTGKSTIMKLFSRKNERKQIIYDPMKSESNWHNGWRPHKSSWWLFTDNPRAVYIYDDDYSFLQAVHNSSDADIFVDEAADIFTLDNKVAHKIMTQGRHRGLRVIYSSQRPRQIAPTVRNQPSIVYLLRLAKEDGDYILRDAGFSPKDIPARPKATGEVITLDLITGQVHNKFYHPEISAHD